MGASKSKIAYEICVVTGDYHASDAGPTMHMVAFDVEGNQSPTLTLENLLQTDENNTIQAKFTIESQAWSNKSSFGRIHHIEFWRVNMGLPLEWFLEKVIVRDRRTGLGGKWEYFFFPVHRWIRAEQHYVVHNFDTFLPKDEPFPQLRADELLERQNTFVFTQRAKGLPVELTSPPLDEIFTYDSKWDIEDTKLQLLNRHGISLDYNLHEPWSSLATLINVYNMYNITEPECLHRWIFDDFAFGAQRLKGCNPFVIRQCKEIPENFGVVVDWLKPHLEGWTVKHILQAKRLYWVNYEMMDGLECQDGREFCSPMALFFATEARHLKPLAIQLQQEVSENSPVFIPSDPPNKWLLAKSWFNMVDACYHLVVCRLLNHLILEGVYSAMRRHLAQSHPIFKLMAPHFRSLLAVNRKLKDWVFESEGWIAQNIQLTKKGIRQLLKRAFKKWRFDTHAYFYRELETRGVYDANALPNYPYRDDALLLNRTFELYVGRIVRLYYPRGRVDLLADYELQNWRREVSSPMSEGGLGLKGIPGGKPKVGAMAAPPSAPGRANGNNNNNTAVPPADHLDSYGEQNYGEDGLQTVEDTVKFLCGWLHLAVIVCGAAVRQPMFDEYGFPPNYPLNMAGSLPDDTLTREDAAMLEQDAAPLSPSGDSVVGGRDVSDFNSDLYRPLVSALPTRHSSLDVMLSIRLASKTQLSRLGHFDTDFIFEPKAVEAVLEFRRNLTSNSNTIQERNRTQRDEYYQYWCLDPANMPNYPGV